MKLSTLKISSTPYFSSIFRHCCLAFVLLFWASNAQTQDALIRATENLKPNVVAITVSFADGSEEKGFGFITGEKDGQLYVVTAGHVVHGKQIKSPQKILLRFYTSLRQYPAEEESWFESDDLSLLTLPKPVGIQWKRQYAHFAPQTYQHVRFIGQNQDWLSPGSGEITRLDNRLIRFSIYTIEPGTSGAPLLNEKGIIGLILEDERIASYALSLTRIKELIGDARYPYFGGELYDPTGNGSETATNQTLTVPEGMVLVKGGTFTMGCTNEQGTECDTDEKPAHLVTLSDFYMGKYEVTVQAFKEFIEATNYQTDADKDGGSYFWNETEWVKKSGINWKYDMAGNLRPASEYNHPVIHVSWNDAIEFCKWLASKTGKKYRLPTEAEWEYAARGGNQSLGYKYAGSNSLSDVAWYNENSGSKTHPVGQKKANELGLNDLSGNVWEWCQDWEGAYSSGSQSNPTGAASGSNRVRRGGGWGDTAGGCRLSRRGSDSPAIRLNLVGFRLVL